MKIAYKVLLIMGGTLVCLILCLTLISSNLIIGSYVGLEQDLMQKDADRALGAVNAEIQAIDKSAKDWAFWDETYLFVLGENEQYPAQNLQPGSLGNLDMDYMIFFNKTGGIIAHVVIDRNTGELLVDDGEFLSSFSALPAVSRQEEPDGVSKGVIVTSLGPSLVSSRPILTSNEEGPVAGTIAMGRILDDSRIKTLSNLTNLPLALHPFTPETIRSDREGSSGNRTETVTSEPGMISTSSVVNDIEGRPAFILAISVPRSIYQRGESTIAFFLLALMIASICILFIAFLLLRQFVVLPLTGFTRLIEKIRSSKDLKSRVSATQNDELGDLGRTFNQMLDSLYLNDQSIRESELKYRTVMEEASDPIILADRATMRITDANRKATDLTGYTKDELSLRAVSDIGISSPDASGKVILGTQGKTGMLPVGDIFILHKLGHSVPAELSSREVVIGDHVFVLIIIHDLTERLHREENIRRAHETLQILSRITQYDLQNRLMALKGFTSISHDMVSDPGHREIIHQQEAIIREIESLIVSMDRYRKAGETIPVWQSINQLVMTISGVWSEEGVRITFDECNVEVYADPSLGRAIEIIIHYLIRRAGTIQVPRISCAVDQERFSLFIECDCEGIPWDEKDVLFDRDPTLYGEYTLHHARILLSITGISLTENGDPAKGIRFMITIPRGSFRIKN